MTQSKNQVVTPGPGRLRLTPSGFHIRATSFLECAEHLDPGKPAWLPVRMFLYARAAELALKAYLLARRRTVADVKGLGHDLALLVQEATAFGLEVALSLTGADIRTILSLNDYYQDKKLEYFELQSALQGFPGLPALDQVRDVVTRLVVGVGPVSNSPEAAPL